MVATSGGWVPAGRHARTRWWISATGRCPLTGSSTANTWIRDAIRRSPWDRRMSPIRSVTAGSSTGPFSKALGVTGSVSRPMRGIASFQPQLAPDKSGPFPAIDLQLACGGPYSRAYWVLPACGKDPSGRDRVRLAAVVDDQASKRPGARGVVAAGIDVGGDRRAAPDRLDHLGVHRGPGATQPRRQGLGIGVGLT